MEPKIYHGNITPAEFAHALVVEFNRGNYRAQQFGTPDKVIIQIASRDRAPSGGQTAISITIRRVADGVSVQVGQQAWLGVAASLGQTAFWALKNPWNILGRLDDLAQDLESLQIPDRVWLIIENTARNANVTQELSDRLRRLVCGYCLTANPVGAPSCIACGAPLGKAQPGTCKNCGFVVTPNETVCPNCGKPL
jgi:hypothetical protein